MTEPAGNAPTDTALFDLTEDPDGALTVHLAGSWVLGRALPRPAEVVRRLEARGVTGVRYDAGPLRTWDTSLLAFARTVEAAAAARGIRTERDGLPSGLVRLLALVESAPVRRVTTAHDPDPAFVEHLGLTTLAAGAWIREFVAFTGEIVLSLGRMLRRRAQVRGMDVIGEMQRAGIEALPVVTLVTFLLGLILAFVGAIQLEMFGASIYVADLVGVGMVRDMAALMTAIVMAGRSGASYAAQIGTMQVNQEVDALQTFGISPVDFLVLPRVLALTLMVPILTVYADVVSILGGASVSLSMLGLSATAYYQQTINAVTVGHLAGGLLKAATYGWLVATAGCFQGLHAARSSAGVGEAATTAVVRGIVSIIAACGVYAFLFYLLGW
jgi:phospholipid/cholesterol/gamma-HCH transport system permease protein